MRQIILFSLFLVFSGTLCIQPQPPKPKKINPLDYAITAPVVAGKYELPICSSLPQTGEVSIIGNQMLDGMQAFFFKLKELTDFNFYITLSTLDDSGSVRKTRENIKTLNPKSPVFLSLFGSSTARAIASQLKHNKLISVFPIEGLEKWRTDKNTNTIFWRASDKDQVTVLIDYALNVLYKKRFAVFYEASEWGDGVFQHIKEVLDKRKIKIMREASYPEGTVKVDYAVREIAKKNPDVILCIAQARPSYYFILKMVNHGFYKASFLCMDRLFSIREELKRKSPGIKLINTSVVPSPFNLSSTKPIQIVSEYVQDMKKFFPNKLLSPVSLEGYINAAILCESIKIAQFPISANKIMNTLQHIPEFNLPRLQGLNLNFNSQTRTLSKRIWIDTGDGKEWEEWLENKEDANDNTQTKN
jgi:ABC-type branched-subunit amino acid transport system substrate-binding protein